MKRDYKPFAELLGGFDKRLTEAQTKVDKAIADLGDGYDPGELTAYVDAEISKISALVSKNAADIAGLAVASTDEIVRIVTDGMNSVLQGAAGAAGEVADAFATAFNRMVNTLTGKSLGKWHQEIYLAAMTLSDGSNDIPLGVVAPYDGKLAYIQVRTESITQLDENTPASLKIVVKRNSFPIGTFNWDDGELSKTWTVDKPLSAGQVLTVEAQDVQAVVAGLSVTLGGDYL